MDIFERALASKQSTIIHGSYGRYPSLVEFYLNSIPELEIESEYELIFRYHFKRNESRRLIILMEPPFDAVIPSDIWMIVLTSHLRLQWDPKTTRLEKCSYEKPLVLPSKVSEDHIVMVPSTSHIWPISQKITDDLKVRVDLSSVHNIHEAYLRLLTFMDLLLPSSVWSLSIPEQIRQDLLNTPTHSIYDNHLLKVLG